MQIDTIGGSFLKKLKWIIYLSLIIIIAYTVHPIILRKIFPISFQEEIIRYSKAYHVDPYLIVAIIKVESNFSPYVVSPKGAMGLMQIMPDTGKWIAEKIELDQFYMEELYVSEVNIKLGSWYLQNLHKQFKGNTELVLAAYNGGSGNVSNWLLDQRFSKDGKTLDHIPFLETRNYVKKVLTYYKLYKKIYHFSV